ncbi:hypothetical protein A9Q83_17270 [Alphaproteobacteria bacterium 46_93_T64]|nr:hypothetical protein A9Q83_17270 [Alphaproteobacteria bacterium 46_93_T64]
MSILKSCVVSLLAMVVVVAAVNKTVSAATLDVRSGILYGALNVNVGGEFYDVQFLEGSCGALFGRCDAAEDFAFTTKGTADIASEALIDQVFVTHGATSIDFDANPENTHGISSTSFGQILTPYYFLSPNQVRVSAAHNSSTTLDLIDSATYGIWDTTLGRANTVYAKWTTVTAVPLPAALPLYGTALGLLGFIGWRRKRVL